MFGGQGINSPQHSCPQGFAFSPPHHRKEAPVPLPHQMELTTRSPQASSRPPLQMHRNPPHVQPAACVPFAALQACILVCLANSHAVSASTSSPALCQCALEILSLTSCLSSTMLRLSPACGCRVTVWCLRDSIHPLSKHFPRRR